MPGPRSSSANQTSSPEVRLYKEILVLNRSLQALAAAQKWEGLDGVFTKYLHKLKQAGLADGQSGAVQISDQADAQALLKEIGEENQRLMQMLRKEMSQLGHLMKQTRNEGLVRKAYDK